MSHLGRDIDILIMIIWDVRWFFTWREITIWEAFYCLCLSLHRIHKHLHWGLFFFTIMQTWIMFCFIMILKSWSLAQSVSQHHAFSLQRAHRRACSRIASRPWTLVPVPMLAYLFCSRLVVPMTVRCTIITSCDLTEDDSLRRHLTFEKAYEPVRSPGCLRIC